MKMNKIKTFLLFAALSLGTLSCSDSLEKDYSLVKLGVGESVYTMEVDGGVLNIPVYSNSSYHLEMISQDSGWLQLKMPSNTGKNGYIRAECDFNESFRRQAIFALCSDVDARRDTVILRQKGLRTAILNVADRSFQAKGKGGNDTLVLVSNIPSEEIERIITYSGSTPGERDWISELSIEEFDSETKRIVISTIANPDSIAPRPAQILLKFRDGWGETVSLPLNIIQRTSLEEVGTVVSMNELKYEIARDDKPIDRYVIVEGIVVSDRSNRNAGENEQVTSATINYTYDRRTVYLEALDGSEGICLITSTVDDNQLNLYDYVQVLLYDTVPDVHEDPAFLILNNVKAGMIIRQVAGDAFDVPAKERTIANLTEEDIFTYVTLKDVEIPVRKGDLMPVNEGYTVAAGGNRLTKYPRLIRDANGDDMYLYTNSTCMFRNTGEILPYGSGKISGVIVHERFPRFEWENQATVEDMEYNSSLGRIGSFQIRPQVKSDIWGNMQKDVENGFSKILAEYRYWNPDESRGVCLPSYGRNGWFTHTYQSRYTGSATKDFTEEVYGQHFTTAISFDYLGPKGKSDKFFFGGHTGNENGLGIVLDLSKESWNPKMDALVDVVTDPVHPLWCGPGATDPVCYKTVGEYTSINYSNSLANIGKGFVPENCYVSFAADEWWDYERNRPYAWLLNISTAGISANSLSLQIAQLNMSQSYYSPRFWKIEWSETDSQDDFNWHLIAEYTVPDISVWQNTLDHSVVGAKQMNFALPLELLGKDNVYIRICPRNDICSSGSDYADSHLSEAAQNVHTNTITYLAVRYN